MSEIWASLVVAYVTYFVGAASPGPTNFAIMATAMNAGRRPAMVFSLGVITASQAWGAVSALGIGALLSSHASAMAVFKVLGGLYLLWLSYRALRTGLTPDPPPSDVPAAPVVQLSLGRYFLRGLGLHITNPKAMLVWFTTISLGMPRGAPGYVAALVVAGCGVLACLVFCTYAIVFSTKSMIRIYASNRRAINAVLVVVFALAGARLIFDQI